MEKSLTFIRNSKFFKASWYKKVYKDAASSDLTPERHYYEIGWKKGYNPGPLFVTDAYLSVHADVARVKVCPLVHYERTRKSENRSIGYNSTVYNNIKKSGLFNKKWYARTYAEVNEMGIDPIVHYLIYGWKKNYNPSTRFNTQFYIDSYPDVAAAKVCPLQHYVMSGKREGRLPGRLDDVFTIEKRGLINSLRQLFYRKKYSHLIKKNKNVRIAVHVHLYYEQLWEEIKGYLRNLQCYQVDLYVTHSSALSDKIKKSINNFCSKPKVWLVDNIGFDVAPFVDFLHKIHLDDYDIIYKIHTKRDVVAKNYYGIYMKGNEWRKFLYEGILDEKIVHYIVNTLADKLSKVGMLSNRKLISQIDNMFVAEINIKTLQELGLAIPPRYQFVMGTMFAARASLFKTIKDAVRPEDFGSARRDVYTLAHVFERALCFNVLSHNYDIEGTEIPYKYDRIRRKQAKIKPHVPMVMPRVSTPASLRFWKKMVQGRRYSISSALREANMSLFNELTSAAGINIEVDEPLVDDTVPALSLRKDYLLDWTVASVEAGGVRTIYREFAQDKIFIERHYAPRRCKGRLRTLTPPMEYMYGGKKLRDAICEAVQANKSASDIVQSLNVYIDDALLRFKTSDQNILKPEVWDAIPQNVLIDDKGFVRYSGCASKCIGGVSKSLFMYRVAMNIAVISRSAGKKMSGNEIYQIYSELCKYTSVNDSFYAVEKLHKSIQEAAKLKPNTFAAYKERIVTLFSRLSYQWKTRHFE